MTDDETTGARRWRSWVDSIELFDGSTDSAWADDRDRISQDVRDPWSGRDRKPHSDTSRAPD
jgi:hypothetical protein